ncbi:hypothetical protein GUITHDRAFT_140788 [Guillardia theta CCMP2712]|uniref:Uncharacterized protein n=3 Tax=Guillardia theta TaxID=55529 RepID=L1J304_GUITC|nr:hypothetical protein GUITHDRAFT_140788 [Guillardia theta CCMP2712]EKX42903.1 hypothetical protein GUITHDRAFT_140788 [Guillardia theta CCMP2712]|eukprot:XP_005829883.1 hypothetical protein GUITHDRAFT_140788 [Guillardia theta CCMP2712]
MTASAPDQQGSFNTSGKDKEQAWIHGDRAGGEGHSTEHDLSVTQDSLEISLEEDAKGQDRRGGRHHPGASNPRRRHAAVLKGKRRPPKNVTSKPEWNNNTYVHSSQRPNRHASLLRDETNTMAEWKSRKQAPEQEKQGMVRPGSGKPNTSRMSETNKKILNEIISLYNKKPPKSGSKDAVNRQKSVEREESTKSPRGVVFTRKRSTLQGKKEESQVVLSPSEFRCPNHGHSVLSHRNADEFDDDTAANRKALTPYGKTLPVSPARRQWSDELGCYVCQSQAPTRRSRQGLEGGSVGRSSFNPDGSEQQQQQQPTGFDYQEFVKRVTKESEEKLEWMAQTFAKETTETKDVANAALLQVEAMIQVWEKEMLRIRDREKDLHDKIEEYKNLADHRPSHGKRLSSHQKTEIVHKIDSLSAMILDSILDETVFILQAQEEEENLGRAMEYAKLQEQDLVRLMESMRMSEQDIVSRTSMMSFDKSREDRSYEQSVKFVEEEEEDATASSSFVDKSFVLRMHSNR